MYRKRLRSEYTVWYCGIANDCVSKLYLQVNEAMVIWVGMQRTAPYTDGVLECRG